MVLTFIASTLKLIRENLVVRLFLWGYISCVILGWALLLLPSCQAESVKGFDALFTVVSAISTTGLSVVDIGNSFSFLGQYVIFLLIQLGGIFYLMLSSYIILHFDQRAFKFLRETTPANLMRQVIAYTVICEGIGLLVLFYFFQNEGVKSPFWQAAFHSVSAFCTAGFSLFSSNLEGYKDHLGINITLAVLSLCGAFGFLLGLDIFKVMKGKAGLVKLFIFRIMQLFVTLAIVIIAASLLYMTMNKPQNFITSFFQTVSAITTTGFSTIDLTIFPSTALIVLIIWMLFGASLVGRGTNLNLAAFIVSLKPFRWIFRDKESRRLIDKKILSGHLQIAMRIVVCYLIVLFSSFLLLSLIEKHSFMPLFFETASALCSSGLSLGITSKLSLFGKSLILFLMFFGKISILIFSFVLSRVEFGLDVKEQKKKIY